MTNRTTAKIVLATLALSTVAFAQPPDAYQIGNASNLNNVDSFVNVTNVAVGNICVNAYVWDQYQELIACCSSLITPNQNYSASARNDLISNTLTGAPTPSIVVKLSASQPVNSLCDATNPNNLLVPGLRASMGSAPGTAGSQTPFLQVPLTPSDLNKNTGYCGVIQVSGSNFGGCRTFRVFNIPNEDVTGLIAAINAANLKGGDTISLTPNGTYTLTSVDNTGYYGPTGLPVISSPITINGNGATIQRSNIPGTPDFRIFLVSNGPSQLTLNALTITGGKGSGGGVLSTGVVLVTNSTITGNGGGDGGGILNYRGTLSVQNSTISYNTNFGGYGGGGILNLSGTATIVNSTIFENRADAPPGFQGRGDAIADAFSPPGSVIVKNSILASPSQGLGNACYASVTSLGHNIAGDASCGLMGSGDLIAPNPLLGPLANNGGPTLTHALLVGSPAINAVPPTDCTGLGGAPLATDQRGVARPQPRGGRCDIGAFELVPGETLVGNNIAVQPTDGTTGGTPVTLAFSSITRSGITTLTSTPNFGPSPPAGFKLDSVYYYLETTAVFTGPITVCISYTADPPPELFHSNDGISWDQVTTSKDTVKHVVCGSVTSLSPFALMRSLDSTPPVIVPAISGTLGANGWYTSNVTVTWSVSDPESRISSSTGCALTTLSANTPGTTLTCSATNGAGLSKTVPVTVKIDKTPPVVSGMPATACSLWPPNHKMVQVATVTAADAVSGLAPGSLSVTGVSNEPSDPKDPDVVITPSGSGGFNVQLRADRLGNSAGRVYTLTARATDLAGNAATATATCTVPHDQGK